MNLNEKRHYKINPFFTVHKNDIISQRFPQK